MASDADYRSSSQWLKDSPQAKYLSTVNRQWQEYIISGRAFDHFQIPDEKKWFPIYAKAVQSKDDDWNQAELYWLNAIEIAEVTDDKLLLLGEYVFQAVLLKKPCDFEALGTYYDLLRLTPCDIDWNFHIPNLMSLYLVDRDSDPAIIKALLDLSRRMFVSCSESQFDKYLLGFAY